MISYLILHWENWSRLRSFLIYIFILLDNIVWSGEIPSEVEIELANNTRDVHIGRLQMIYRLLIFLLLRLILAFLMFRVILLNLATLTAVSIALNFFRKELQCLIKDVREYPCLLQFRLSSLTKNFFARQIKRDRFLSPI